MQTDATKVAPIGKLLPKKVVAQALAVGTRTVMMWVDKDPSFPRPITHNKRVYFLEPDIENYKRRLVAKAMGASV